MSALWSVPACVLSHRHFLWLNVDLDYSSAHEMPSLGFMEAYSETVDRIKWVILYNILNLTKVTVTQHFNYSCEKATGKGQFTSGKWLLIIYTIINFDQSQNFDQYIFTVHLYDLLHRFRYRLLVWIKLYLNDFECGDWMRPDTSESEPGT